MTEKDAIYWLELLQSEIEWDHPMDMWIALEIAIKVLKDKKKNIW